MNVCVVWVWICVFEIFYRDLLPRTDKDEERIKGVM